MYRIPRYKVQLVRDGSDKADIKIIRSPRDAYDLLRSTLKDLPVEYFWIIMLDVKNKVIGTSLVSVGALSQTIVSPRDVFQRAILANSAAIILVHNHPSGDTTPSQEDQCVTKTIVEGGKILGISVLDHIIIGDDNYSSLKEKGII